MNIQIEWTNSFILFFFLSFLIFLFFCCFWFISVPFIFVSNSNLYSFETCSHSIYWLNLAENEHLINATTNVKFPLCFVVVVVVLHLITLFCRFFSFILHTCRLLLFRLSSNFDQTLLHSMHSIHQFSIISVFTIVLNWAGDCKVWYYNNLQYHKLW